MTGIRQSHVFDIAEAPLPGMVGSDPAMRDVYRLVRAVAELDVPVAIVGETGTGKELVARALHDLSSRRPRPFIAVNAAAIPESLFESELFGHTRDAFSGAREETIGVIEAAHGGTLYLDELGAVPQPIQAKLLRVVEGGELRRVGSVKVRTVTPRWVASVQGWSETGDCGAGIRPDLWHRLTVIVELPPLRARPGDIPALVGHFLDAVGVERSRLEGSALEALTEHGWPGNVRELRQVLQRARLRSQGLPITAALISAELRGARATPGPRPPAGAGPATVRRPVRPSGLAQALERAEATAIAEALRWANGNRERAAAVLGIGVSSLYRKLDRLSVSRN